MSVGRKIRWLTGIGLSVFSAVFASQVSFADYVLHDETDGDSVTYTIDVEKRTMYIDGKGKIRGGIVQKDENMSKPLYSYLSVGGNWVFNASKMSTRSTDSGRAVQKPIPLYSLINKVIIDPDSGLCAIGEKAFDGFAGLDNMVIPGNIKTIGKGAFRGCSKLREVEMKYGVEAVDHSIFSLIPSLESITWPLSIRKVGRGIYYNSNGLEVIGRCGTKVTPNNGYFDISLKNITFVDKDNNSFKVSGLGFDSDAEGFNLGSVRRSVEETFNLATGLNANAAQTFNIIKGYFFGVDVYKNEELLPLPVVGRDEYGNKIGASLGEITNEMTGSYLCKNFALSVDLELLKKNPLTLNPLEGAFFARSKEDLSKLVSWITSMNAYKIRKSY